MHRCLQLQEIVELICQQGFHGSAAGRKGIVALAQTCRSLYEPATNVIWHRIKSLRPLVNCIPAEYWNSIESENFEAPMPLHPDDILRVQLLARRIRAFGVDSKEFDRLPKSNSPLSGLENDVKEHHYETLSHISGFTPLLPNVREVSMVKPDSAMLIHVNLFTTPQITTLRIMPFDDIKRWRFLIISFLRSTGNRYPQLKNFDLRMIWMRGGSMSCAIETAMQSCKWDNLSNLIIAGGSTKILRGLLQHPSLKKITIQTFALELDTTIPPLTPNPRPSGPTLEAIGLFVPRMSSISEFIRFPFTKTRVNQLTAWSTPRYSSSEHWHLLLQSLGDQLNPLALESLSIGDNEEQEGDNNYSYVVDLSNSPLFNFRNLTQISIQTSGILPLDDQILRYMIESWPRVQSLQAWGEHSSQSPPKATLEGIAVFADNCPYLEVLALEFTANTTTERVSKPSLRPRFGRKLKTLDVRNSPISKPGPVAALLADLFPCIKELISKGSAQATWNEVGELYPIFVKVRSDEATRPPISL